MSNNQPIRILHYVGSLNIGGSQTMIMEFYRNIDRNKFQFDFIVDRKNELFFKEEIEKMGGKVFILNNFKGYNYFSYKKQLKNFFKEHSEYRIIHGHVRSVASIYLNIAKKYGIKTISHSHSTSNGKGISAIIKKILQYKIRYIADYFMGCSKEANIWLFGKKIANSNRCSVINNPIDYDKFKFNLDYRNEIRKKYNIDKNTIVLGHVGRFVDVKNHKYLIDILEKVLLVNKNYILMLCGDGELKEKIKYYAQSKGIINNVLFVDANAEIYKYYSAFDLFLFPSKYEGLGIAAIEAQVSNLPVILSNCVPRNVSISKNLTFLDIKPEFMDNWLNYIKAISAKPKLTRDKIELKNDYNAKVITQNIINIYIRLGAFHEDK